MGAGRGGGGECRLLLAWEGQGASKQERESSHFGSSRERLKRVWPLCPMLLLPLLEAALSQPGRLHLLFFLLCPFAQLLNKEGGDPCSNRPPRFCW